MIESYLVDTNAWIFFFEDSPRLSNHIAEILEHPESVCYFSIASIWEASIKAGLGKLRLAYDLKRDLPGILEENGFHILSIDFEDVAGVKDLPSIHGDPFDRIQIMQAQRRGWKILSHDSFLDAYDIERIG